jgi:hypothetical protein
VPNAGFLSMTANPRFLASSSKAFANNSSGPFVSCGIICQYGNHRQYQERSNLYSVV